MNKVLLMVFLLGLTGSCRNKQDSNEIDSLVGIVNSVIGTKLIMPEILELYAPYLSNIENDSILRKGIRLVTYIDVSCGTCLRDFDLWVEHIPEYARFKVPVVFICRSEDRFEVFKYLCELEKFKMIPYPFFLDLESKYVEQNSFMKEVPDFRTVLIDKEDTIILTGNPIRSRKINRLYIKQIQELIGH